MESSVKRKNPIIAICLSFLLPGLGHLYAKSFVRGIILFALVFIWGSWMLAYVWRPESQISSTIIMLYIGLVLVLFAVHADAYAVASRFNRKNNINILGSWKSKFLLIIAIIIVLPVTSLLRTFYMRTYVVQAFKIPSASMRPALIKGDRLLSDKKIYKTSSPQRGDVIIFDFPKNPKRTFVMRLIGLPGESLEIRHGDIYVDGTLVEQPNVKNIYYYNRGPYGKEWQVTTIPENHYFVLGDNSASSHDSRFWGFVPRENIIGKAFKIYWPMDRSGPIN